MEEHNNPSDASSSEPAAEPMGEPGVPEEGTAGEGTAGGDEADTGTSGDEQPEQG